MSAPSNLNTDLASDAVYRFAELDTPVGLVRVVAAAGVIHRVDMQTQDRFREIPADAHRPEDPLLRQALEQLRAYFAGNRLSFDLPMDPAGGTPFQRRAWRALCAIPFGETRTYADQARAIGAPAAVRAVGAANARNPLGIIVPCHRVIGSDGKLTGYAGGLPAKAWLLAHEARVLAAASEQVPPAASARTRAEQIELFPAPGP